MRVLALALFSVLSVTAHPSMAAVLPGGANSLTEAHQDWTLLCGLRGEGEASAVVCRVSQRQLQRETNRQVLAVTLTPSIEGAISGTLIMPFGLALGQGVKLQFDDAGPTSALSYSTCLPAGCLVPLSLTGDTVGQARNGTTLKVFAVDTVGKNTVFSISLSGLSSALDRATELTGR